jgi:hypothetical protein
MESIGVLSEPNYTLPSKILCLFGILSTVREWNEEEQRVEDNIEKEDCRFYL